MYFFSARSMGHLVTAHQSLVDVFTLALEVSPVDFGISCGHRGRDAQDIAYNAGLSKLQYPNSLHNRIPAEAVDFYPVVDGHGAVWHDERLFFVVAGIVLGVGHALGIKLRWGGAWDGTLNRAGSFQDLPHMELRL